jgi:hypothetical protein
MIKERKIHQYNGMSCDLTAAYKTALGASTGCKVYMKKNRSDIEDQVLRLRGEDLGPFVYTDGHVKDIIGIIENSETSKKYDVKIHEDKRIINRKCRTILEDFNKTVLGLRDSVGKRVMVYETTSECIFKHQC